MVKLYLILIFLLVSFQLYSQELNNNDITLNKQFQENLELFIEKSEDETDFTELMESLIELQQNPIDINHASINKLSQIPFLSTLQIHNLYGYIQTYGEMLSIYELHTIEGFDSNTFELTAPFIIVKSQRESPKIKPKYIFKYGHHEVLMRYQRLLEDKKGYSINNDSLFKENLSNYYLGNADNYLIKYRFSYKDNISIGFTGQKDPGEFFLKSNLHDSAVNYLQNPPRNGFDFNSIHCYIKDVDFVKALAIGDYHAQFGQGLTTWTGLSFGKSSSSTGIQKFGKGIKAFRSTNESNFMRGAAVTLKFKPIEVSLFYSNNYLDARLTKTDSTSYISTLYTTGLHRSINELNYKHKITLKSIGGNVNFELNKFKIGATATRTVLSDSIEVNEEFYQTYEHNFKENINAGINYFLNLGLFSFFGESTIDKNFSTAHIHGLNFFPHSRLSISALYRKYHPGFTNLFANAISEGSHVKNESGFLTGFIFYIHKKLTLSGYVDNYRFPWLKFQTDAPTRGSDYFFNLKYDFYERNSITFRYRKKIKETNQSDLSGKINQINTMQKNYFRAHLNYRAMNNLFFNTRLEYLFVTKEGGYKGTGALFYQEAKWTPDFVPLNVSLRYALFDTDSYEERIYSYEPDLLYAFSVPAYYNKGSKVIFVLRYQINENISSWFRISHLLYNDLTSMGTGADEIDGNQKTEIKLQLKIKL